MFEREAEARKNNDLNTADAIAAAAMLSQHQSQAIAYELQQAAAALPPSANVVAIVNLGQHASLMRNWAEATPPAVALPPMSPYILGASYAAQAGVAGGLAYGVYRGFRRFPRTVGALGTLATAMTAMFAYGVSHPETMLFGPRIREALARPRITSPLMRLDK